MINAELVLATRGLTNSTNGLITFRVNVPLFIWTEILTHKRFARNASSARAMSTSRYVDMGHYTPETFYSQGKGMQSSNTPIKYQKIARALWGMGWHTSTLFAALLDKLGVAKEQRNRLVNPTKFVTGLVTGTEDAWKEFLKLRNHHAADKAMQFTAQVISSKIAMLNNQCAAHTWRYSDEHIPYCDYTLKSNQERIKVAAARIARVSYNRPPNGKNDFELADSLLKERHYSPFEHIAFYVRDPGLSAIFSKPTDSHTSGIAIPDNKYGWLWGWGWKSARVIEENKMR